MYLQNRLQVTGFLCGSSSSFLEALRAVKPQYTNPTEITNPGK